MPSKSKADFERGFKIIWIYLKTHRRDVVLLSTIGIIGAGLGSIVPYLGGKIIDSLISPYSLELNFPALNYPVSAFIFFVSVFFGARAVQELLNRHSSLKSGKLGILLEAEYVVKNFSKILDFPSSFFKKYKIGEVGDKVNRAANALDNILSRIIITLVPEFLEIIFATFLIFIINKYLASIIVGSVIIYVLFLVRVAPKLVPLQRKMHGFYNRAYGDLWDAIGNIPSVKQAVAESYEKKKLKKNFISKAIGVWNRYIEIWESLTLYQQIIIVFTQLAIYIVAFDFIRDNQMTIGQLVMFNGYSAMFFGPFVRLGHNWQWLQNGLVALERAEEMLKQKPEEYRPKKIIKIDDIKGDITFENVSFAYENKKKLILEDVNFEVKSGEAFALVGESGVGKTTLIDLISRYYIPTKGKILIDGIDTRRLDLRFLRSKIAVVPQDVVLFNDTVKNNIRYGNFSATDEEIILAAKMAHADHFINKFPKKYDQLVGEKGIKLSTGQRQRVALTRAFLRKPKILILDEPTSALDAVSEKYVKDALEKLMKGRTTFIIAHRLSTVRKADKIIVLDKGRIVETGKHEELVGIEDGFYRRLYDLQIGF